MDVFNYLHFGIGIATKNVKIAKNWQRKRSALINVPIQIQSDPFLCRGYRQQKKGQSLKFTSKNIN